MNSFSQLNTHGSQRVLVDDSRKANIILNKTELTDLDQTFNLYPTYNSQAFNTKNYGVNIDEIINYATANAKLTATILPSNMVSTYNASLVFNVVTPVTLSKPAANIYQLTGFQNNIDWDNNVSFTFNYPQGYTGLGIWYVTFVLDWYDETTGRAKSVTWNFYNTGHYYLALLPSRFDINPRLGIIKRSKANFISSFQFKKSVQTSANFLDVFALRGFIELRLMKRSSAQLATPVTFTANGRLANMVRTSSNVASNFSLLDIETKTRLRRPKTILITPVTFRTQGTAINRSKANLASVSLLANPKNYRTRRTSSSFVTASTIYNNNYNDYVWQSLSVGYTDVQETIIDIAISENRIFVLKSNGADEFIEIYDFNGNRLKRIVNTYYNWNDVKVDKNNNLYFRHFQFYQYQISIHITTDGGSTYTDYSPITNSTVDGSFDVPTAKRFLLGAPYCYDVGYSTGIYAYTTTNGFNVIQNNSTSSVTLANIRALCISDDQSRVQVIVEESTGTFKAISYGYTSPGNWTGVPITLNIQSWYKPYIKNDDASVYGQSQPITHPTGGLYSKGSNIYSIKPGEYNGSTYQPQINMYDPRNASSTIPWLGQGLLQYSSNKLEILNDGTLITNMNNFIVDATPLANQYDWPNKLLLGYNKAESDSFPYSPSALSVEFASNKTGTVIAHAYPYSYNNNFRIFKR